MRFKTAGVLREIVAKLRAEYAPYITNTPPPNIASPPTTRIGKYHPMREKYGLECSQKAPYGEPKMMRTHPSLNRY